MPSIVIVCTNCGFMAYQNLGILGLLSLKMKLSNIEIERLKTWVNGSGTYRVVRYLGDNVQYFLSGKPYIANGNKEISEWNVFFKKLLNLGLIKVADHNKDNESIYKLTEKAYDYVKNLDK